MENKQFSWPTGRIEQKETRFKLIDPEDYPAFGIHPQDVPMGTFASEDHPSFLPSRFGGNAYGLGLIEQSVLSRGETDFLESLNFQDVRELGSKVRQVNEIYQKLGLLIRFGTTGKPYFLIPITLVAHSLEEVKSKADEIEELVQRHITQSRKERLDVGILTSQHDLMVHELTARLSIHRIVLLDTLDRVRSWRAPLDVVILPKDPFEFLLEQQLPRLTNPRTNQQVLLPYATFLAGKLHDIVEPGGRIHILTHASVTNDNERLKVRFRSEEDLKHFLIFSHVFKTRRNYMGEALHVEMDIFASDLHFFLYRFVLSDPNVKRLLDHRQVDELTVEEINRLPHLSRKVPRAFVHKLESHWKTVFEPFFRLDFNGSKTPSGQHGHWRDRIETDRELPESLLILEGTRREPEITLNALDEQSRHSGMMGCSPTLVAEYRNSFTFLLDVLSILIRIRDNHFPKLSDLERARLSNPFIRRCERFTPIAELMDRVPQIEQARHILNPDDLEGASTPVLENIPKLSLLGFSKEQLREILLIVVGHTSMSRIVFGKLPPRSLKPVTDRAKSGDAQEIIDILRICRLMSMAEIAADLGDAFTSAQAKELYRLYDDATSVAADQGLDWERLQDLRISSLGGVQNKTIREMLKFFGLFEFLDDWQDFVTKGPFQKEVLCDYDPEKLERMEEVFELVRVADEFKETFTGDSIFGQSFFFRQFLECEFHGTGLLFPRLGARAGFVLLWVTINASERRALNFNPVLSGIPADRVAAHIGKIRDMLLKIPIELLQPDLFEEIKQRLRQGSSAFILDTGIRVVNHPGSRATDVAFVDVEEDFQRMETLLNLFESQKLRGISLRHLSEMEQRFSEMESFHEYLHHKGCELQCDLFEHPGAVEARDRRIGAIERRLRAAVGSQIFIAEEIFDSVNVLARHCPEILRFVLPEFRPVRKTVREFERRDALAESRSMRRLEKFQALVLKDRSGFQDHNTFYRLAKHEYGPLAEEGIGPTLAQMDTLEYLVKRVEERPPLYRALMLALLFQEIGKDALLVSANLQGMELPVTHAELGALILEHSSILRRYGLDAQTSQAVIQLIRYHGMFGRVIEGVEPVISLEPLLAQQDDRLLDCFVLQSVIAAAAVREGLLISDLLDLFLGLRSQALQILGAKSHWEGWFKDTLRSKGAAVIEDAQLAAKEVRALPTEQMQACGFWDEGVSDERLWHGRQVAAIERLFKLFEAPWVDYHDLQMYLMKMPVNFIGHKKKLKSVGPVTFEKQIHLGADLLELLAGLTPEVRYYFLYSLDHLGSGMRVSGFQPLTRLLEPVECLKLLLFSFQALHHHFGTGVRGGLVDFRPLAKHIEKRYQVLHRVLHDSPLPERCFDPGRTFFAPHALGEIELMPCGGGPAIRVGYRDTVRFDAMVRSLGSLWDHETLGKQYRSLVEQLRQTIPYDTRSFGQELFQAFQEQRKRINDLTLKRFRERLEGASNFTELQGVLGDIEDRKLRITFSEEQQAMLKEMFDYHRSRLRDAYLDNIYRHVSELMTMGSIANYWEDIKHELYSFRTFVGKEYELVLARYVEERMKRLALG